MISYSYEIVETFWRIGWSSNDMSPYKIEAISRPQVIWFFCWLEEIVGCCVELLEGPMIAVRIASGVKVEIAARERVFQTKVLCPKPARRHP